VAEFILSTGIPPESCDPFTPNQAGTPRAGWQLRTVRAAQHNWYRGITLNEFKALLVLLGPITTGMNVPADFFNYAGGVYSKAEGPDMGFHLVSVVGCNDFEHCFIAKNSWGQDWGEHGFFRIAYSMFGEGTGVGFGVLTDTYAGAVLASPTMIPVALKTLDGHYLTVVNGGGLGGPNAGPTASALHTDATKVGPWETFEIVWTDATHFGIRTSRGHYVTAVNGGGVGGPNNASSPVHTDASRCGPWERLLLNYDFSSGRATLQTPSGQFVTAVNGGGFGGPNNVPIHTDATVLGPWETFSLELLRPV
jgi:hypothetical protein